MGGAFALAAHGHARFTKDLDVMVLVDELSRIHRALQGDRYTMMNEVAFQDARTGLMIDIFPIEDPTQREVFEKATRTELQGAKRIRVITPEGLVLMLLREATEGDAERRPERLRDLETLDRKQDLDWGYIRTWTEKMGYVEAYEDLRVGDKPPP